MESIVFPAFLGRMGAAVARYAGPFLTWFNRRQTAKRDQALAALAIAEQLERHANVWSCIGGDNAAALRSDARHPVLICALAPLPAANPTGDAAADLALLPLYSDLARHVADVNAHVDETAAHVSVDDSFRILEARADETAVRAWRLADAYRERFRLKPPQLGGREARIRAATFERVGE